MEIQDYPNYLIYDDGRVFSKGDKFHKPRFLKPQKKNQKGYLGYCLGRGNNVYIHRLVATHYIPNPDNKEQVDHIDGNIFNNDVENLKWVTTQENANNHINVPKNNKLGIKNICIINQKGYTYYQFSININKKKHSKLFKTLDEAIKYKEEYLK